MMPVLAVVLLAISLGGYFTMYRTGFCDFRAFYCGGHIVSAGADPYREHPLHECERSLPQVWAPTFPRVVTLPAPYPPATLALFGLLARLPFGAALAAWLTLCATALGLAIRVLARRAAIPAAAACVIVGIPAAAVALPLGQATPLLLAAIVAGAAWLDDGRPRAAALAVLATLIDPHVGLGLWVAAVAGLPSARRLLAAGALVVVAANILAGGPALAWEYAHAVIPAHALANVADFGQFSAANVAFSLGAPPAAAVALGSAWSAAALVGGTLAALRWRARLGAGALVVVPAAFAVVGGVHTHLQQLSLALPAFVFAMRGTSGRTRATFVVATYTASVPWLLVAGFPVMYGAIAVFAVVYARLLRADAVAVPLAAVSFGVLGTVLVAILAAPLPVPPPMLTAPAGNPLAEVGWAAFVRANFVPPQSWYLLAKIPTFAAFGALFVALAVTGRRIGLAGGFVR